MHQPSYHARFLLRDFQRFVERERLVESDRPTLLAASAGLDSTVLVHLFRASGYPFVLGHVNYHLRGADSEADETFVRELAVGHGVPVHVAQVAGGQLKSIQAEARELRYAQLASWREHFGYGTIATAHHGDDSVETAVANFVRGTGLRGLRGILPRRGPIVRPLLFTRKKIIAAYAEQECLTHRTDRSNADTKYRRNQLRHRLIPQLEALNPQFSTNLLNAQQQWRETEWLADFAIRTLLQQHLTPQATGHTLDLAELRQHPALQSLLFAWLQPFGFGADRVAQLCTHLRAGKSGGQFAGPAHTLSVKSGKLWLVPRSD